MCNKRGTFFLRKIKTFYTRDDLMIWIMSFRQKEQEVTNKRREENEREIWTINKRE